MVNISERMINVVML